MSRLEELIAELCPDGVEYKELGDCVFKPKNIKWQKQSDQTYHYVDLTSVDRDTHEIYDTQVINANSAPSRAQQIILSKDILFGSTRPMLKRYCQVPNEYNGQICSTGFCILRAKPDIILDRWLYHIISSSEFYMYIDEHQKGSSYPAITDKEVKAYKLPLPPLEIQSEIVRILDAFSELNAELKAELKARKEQYTYYLNNLLDIKKLHPDKIMYVGDLFDIKNGLNKEKSAFGKGDPIVNFTDVYNYRYLTANMIKGKVSLSESEIERYSVQKGDVFFTRTSETRDDVGMSSTIIEDIPNCTFSGFVLRARPKTNLLLPKFCSYYFSTNQVRDTIIRYASFTTRATTTGPKLSKIPVPILPLEEQAHIVRILDNYEKLCSSLTSGLPAEIAAREKQYEYYRDLLLTFKPKVTK